MKLKPAFLLLDHLLGFGKLTVENYDKPRSACPTRK